MSSGLEDTITCLQRFGDRFGDLNHPGEFSREPSPTAAGYIVVVEALEVRSLPVTAEPLTADLDSLIPLRERISGLVDADSLAALDEEIRRLRDFLGGKHLPGAKRRQLDPLAAGPRAGGLGRDRPRGLERGPEVAPDSDTGPIFHVDGGAGVFGSYAADGFRLYAEKGEDGNMKVTAYRRSPSWPGTPP